MASNRTRGGDVKLRTVDDLEALVDGSDRFVDQCLVFRCEETQEYLGEVGGRWDRLLKTIVDEPPITCVFVDLDESQLPAARAFFVWLEKYRTGDLTDRDVILFAGGARGGGKTFLGTLLLVAIAIEMPKVLTWAVSPTLDRREEIERTIRDWIPSSWFTYHGTDFRFTFRNGSSLRSLSDESLGKRGEAVAIFFNESQDLQAKTFALALPALRKLPGLMILAGNPPDSENEDGNWTVDLKEALEDGDIAGTYAPVDPKKNRHISQVGNDMIGQILRRVVPNIADVDFDGNWRRAGRQAYADFLARPTNHPKGGHIGDPPDIAPSGQELIDVTREVTSKKTGGRENGFSLVPCCDFGRDPHCAMIILRVLQRPDGVRIYYVEDELVVPGTENDLAEALIEWAELKGVARDQMVIVADGSGKWQKTSGDRDGDYSHAIMKSYGEWMVVPPRRPSNPKAPSGVGRNPLVPNSLSQMEDVLKANRLLVSPRCVWLIECLKKCAIKRGEGGVRLDKSKDKDQFTHITDALRYGIHWLEPRRQPERRPITSGTIGTFGRGIKIGIAE